MGSAVHGRLQSVHHAALRQFNLEPVLALRFGAVQCSFGCFAKVCCVSWLAGQNGLGFARSDWLETELAPGINLEVRFYHCNARHHTVALARAPFDLPQVLHHVMFEMNDRDDVGAAFDRLWATDLGIPNGLGRHDNDGMFSFYVVSPAGFQVEVGHGARAISDSWTDNRRYDRISRWGHQPVARR